VVKGLVFLLFPACGFINGYCAARLYAFMHGVDWQLLWISTSLFFPLIFGLSMIAIDACEYIETGRVSALVLSEGFALGGVFALVNLPMTFIGTFIGYKRTPLQTPTKISRVPREPPAGLPWFLNFNLMAMVSGMVPVLVIGFELYQILYCIRGVSYINLLYWSFYCGFLVFLIVIVQLSITQTYLLLCYEEYRWWWRCFLLGSSPGLVALTVIINYFVLSLKATQMTTVAVYIIYTALFCLALALMSGAVALMASFQFNLAIFKRAKRED